MITLLVIIGYLIGCVVAWYVAASLNDSEEATGGYVKFGYLFVLLSWVFVVAAIIAIAIGFIIDCFPSKPPTLKRK